MIVKNEEKFLAGCLESVKDLVDEMVIVDTGSSDRTLDIARSFGARVYSMEWSFDFSKARNEALKHCRGEWVLWLDADERLPVQFHETIRAIIQNNTADAVIMKIRSEVNGPLGKTPHYQQSPRLFRHMAGVRFEFPVHEQIVPSLIRNRARLVMTDIVIEHLGYAQDESTIRQKIQRNKVLLEKHLEMEPENAYAHFQYAQTLELVQESEKARKHFLNAIKYDREGGIRPSCLLHLAAMDIKEKAYDRAIEKIQESYRLAPNQYTAPNMLGEIYYYLGEYALAARYYREALAVLYVPVTSRKLDLLVEKELNAGYVFGKFAAAMARLGKFEELGEEILYFNEKKGYISPWILEPVTEGIRKGKYREDQQLHMLDCIGKNPSDEELAAALKFLFQSAQWSQTIPLRKKITAIIVQRKWQSPDYLEWIIPVLMDWQEYSQVYYLLEHIPEHPAFLEWKGICEIKLQKLDKAVRTYEQLAKNHSGNTNYLKILGGLYARTGALEKAALIAQTLNPSSIR